MELNDEKDEEDDEWKKIERKIKDQITCSICTDVFVDPKTVPCLHTFCKECLEKSIAVNKKSAVDACCPLCREKIPQDNVTRIPTNFDKKSLVEIYNQKEERRKSAGIARKPRCQRSLQSTDNVVASNKTSAQARYGPVYEHQNLIKQNPRHDIERSYSHNPIYVAKLSYSPRKKTELAFKEGDKFYIMNTDDPSWWLAKNVEISGKEGYIPSNYVVEFDRNKQNALPQSRLKEEAGKKLGQPLNSYQHCVATYSYSPEQENYLSFNKGEMLYVINTNVNGDSNWWLAGKMGSIPSNRVSEFRTNQSQSKPEEDDRTGKKLEIFKACNFNHPLVIANCDYSPRKDSELGFKEGDLLHVVNNDDREWWLAGQIGCIPCNYVSLVSNGYVNLQGISANNSTLSYPLFIVKYDYMSRTKDDLNIKKGDLLYIIDNDDDGWWLARIKDSSKEGYIPSSYVKEYKSSLDAEE